MGRMSLAADDDDSFSQIRPSRDRNTAVTSSHPTTQ
jgi:hypothetical protein